VCDRLDERQRVERGVRLQRHRSHQRQSCRNLGSGVRTGAPLPDGDAVRARPHTDRAPVPHAPARARRPAVGRAPRQGAAPADAGWTSAAGAASAAACAARGRASPPRLRPLTLIVALLADAAIVESLIYGVSGRWWPPAAGSLAAGEVGAWPALQRCPARTR